MRSCARYWWFEISNQIFRKFAKTPRSLGVNEQKIFISGSVFDAISPYSVWNLDNSRAAAAVPEYETVDPQDTQDQGAIDPSVALYLTENLLANYVARQDKLQQQRKQAAIMDEVFGLH